MSVIVAAHGGLIALLFFCGAAPTPPRPATQMVQIMAAASPAADRAPQAPTPRPQERPKPRPTPPAAARPRLAATSDLPLSDQAVRSESPVQTPAPDAVSAAPQSSSSAASAGSASAAGAGSASAAVSPPRFDANYLLNPAPAYPPLSRKMGEEGKVMLHVLVDANGRATRIEIKKSSAWPRLDQAAQDAVARWKFIPAKRGDESVDAWVLVPIVFNLRS